MIINPCIIPNSMLTYTPKNLLIVDSMLHCISHILTTKVRNDYDAIAESFSETRQTPWKGWNLIKKYFNKDVTVLDIGCGNGRLSEFFTYKEYTGVDISQNLIALAKKERGNTKTQFQTGSFTKLPQEKFDRVISIAAFHHLPSSTARTQALKHIKSTLKEDGIFIFSVWNLLFNEKYTWIRIKALLRSMFTLGIFHYRDLFIPWKKGLNKRKRYYYAFLQTEVKRLLEKTGFEILDIIPSAHGKRVEIPEAFNIYFVCKKQKNPSK